MERTIINCPRISRSLPNPVEAAPSVLSGLRIGTAGWVVPSGVAECFPAEGSHLQRYAARFCAAEINSSFHRPHRRTTYERWAASVPKDFRFSVKLPKAISHASSTEGQEAFIDRFSKEVHGLGQKLGVVLVQFPPKRDFERGAMDTLLGRLAAAFHCPIACEPRHASWFTPAANDLLVQRGIARVAADPSPVPHASEPGGWPALRYYRLHGSPIIYRSSYDGPTLAKLSDTLVGETIAGAETWCIFDNTASSAAAGNAITVANLAQRAAAKGAT
jgi:uncharacterized protein YecE (DUF72 family)